MDLAALQGRIAAAGLAFRGAFHPQATDLAPASPNGRAARTLVLVGFTGPGHWPAFTASPEAADRRPDPLDRWSRRVVGELATAVGATACFPFDGPPWLPFQRWAQKAEPVHPSPIGVLIHPDWGLWHAYRGALAFVDRIALPTPDHRPSPCETCADKPCLTACPVGAFTSDGFDVAACIDYLDTPAGQDCVDRNCRARRACPVGASHRYAPDESRFHLTAFRAAQRGRT